MPIYAYRCGACGHSQDFLQKISDPVLTTCPACAEQALTKQVTAAGFQLKGSGWYVTDFRGGDSGNKKPDDKAGEGSSDVKGETADAKADGKPEAKPDAKPVTKPDTAAPAVAPAAAPPPASPPATGSS